MLMCLGVTPYFITARSSRTDRQCALLGVVDEDALELETPLPERSSRSAAGRACRAGRHSATARAQPRLSLI